MKLLLFYNFSLNEILMQILYMQCTVCDVQEYSAKQSANGDKIRLKVVVISSATKNDIFCLI